MLFGKREQLFEFPRIFHKTKNALTIELPKAPSFSLLLGPGHVVDPPSEVLPLLPAVPLPPGKSMECH